MIPSRLLCLLPVQLLVVFALAVGAPRAASAVPTCSGRTSVAALGAVGCTLGNTTFSNFAISGVSITGDADPTGADADQLLIDISPTGIVTGLIDPPTAGVSVSVTHASGSWNAGSLFLPSRIAFTLSYSVSSTDRFAGYQLRGFGGSGGLRSGTWNIDTSLSDASGPLGAVSRDKSNGFLFDSFDFPSPVSTFDISNEIRIGDRLSQFDNNFAPVPEASTAALVGVGLLACSRVRLRRRH